ncbi:hypothetical protein [Acaryochloris sp. CCMEE 5410]|uniref:hypothetical protein n=1 Tax=Acaryochloris sp. CCMEE 5410 TaxID=310037 RepID=UPI0002483B25|nr:hypothetical protein [Acaryochloris sp. CCMEE 5410]KAI9133245.1 hypothetical protein ON05_007900 [Acaryochloris sp. CCMEE 5410]
MVNNNLVVGDLNRFGFQLGFHPSSKPMRKVSIFIGGQNLTPFDNSAYLPSFVNRLQATSEWLKGKIDYLKYEQLLNGLNLTEIHNTLAHNHLAILTDDEWDLVRKVHTFGDWGEITDDFNAFLIPYFDRLYLTYQLRNNDLREFNILDVVDGIESTPYELIMTLDEAISCLTGQK